MKKTCGKKLFFLLDTSSLLTVESLHTKGCYGAGPGIVFNRSMCLFWGQLAMTPTGAWNARESVTAMTPCSANVTLKKAATAASQDAPGQAAIRI